MRCTAAGGTSSDCYRLHLAFCCIAQESLKSCIREWMLERLHKHLVGHRCDMCTRFCCSDDVHRMPHRCSDDLGFDSLHIPYLGDILENADSIVSGVIEPPEEHAHVRCARVRSSER